MEEPAVWIILLTVARPATQGPNIGTILEAAGDLIPLFNPRTQNWFHHFESERGYLKPLSKIAEATIKIMELNHPLKVEERFELVLSGFYP